MASSGFQWKLMIFYPGSTFKKISGKHFMAILVIPEIYNTHVGNRLVQVACMCTKEHNGMVNMCVR